MRYIKIEMEEDHPIRPMMETLYNSRWNGHDNIFISIHSITIGSIQRLIRRNLSNIIHSRCTQRPPISNVRRFRDFGREFPSSVGFVVCFHRKQRGGHSPEFHGAFFLTVSLFVGHCLVILSSLVDCLGRHQAIGRGPGGVTLRKQTCLLTLLD